MADFGVQRDTIRRALKVLEEEGRLYKDAAGARYAAASPVDPPAGGSLALMVRQWRNQMGPSDILRGLTQTADIAGRSVIWLDQDGKSPTRQDLMPSAEVLKSRGIDAVLAWPEIPADLDYLRALRASMPLVILDRRVPGFESDFVGFDDLMGGRRITEHLLAVGHRRIGFVSTEPYLATTQMRVRGYLLALEEAGIAPCPEWVLHGSGIDGSPSPGVVENFLRAEGDPLTAVVCANDSVAATLIVLLRSSGRRVPQDVAVTGFGNMLAPLLDALQLTTMNQPFEQMGKIAGEFALARLEGRGDGIQEAMLPLKLVVRGSCGTPMP
jgi:DNA-binding LacI/PurR family transcriptional regulator